jgi:hypothetical protein
VCPLPHVTPLLRSRLSREVTSPGLQGGPLPLAAGSETWLAWWNECEWEGARSRGSPWPGCWQVYRLLSPPLSSLSFPAKRPRPFLSPLQAAPPHSHVHWRSFLFSELAAAFPSSSCREYSGADTLWLWASRGCPELGWCFEPQQPSSLPPFKISVSSTYCVVDTTPCCYNSWSQCLRKFLPGSPARQPSIFEWGMGSLL